MVAIHPKSGKGRKFSKRELEQISPQWKGHTLSDSGGLIGEVRVSKTGLVSVKFVYRYKWGGELISFYCGTYPATDIEQIRKVRDETRISVKSGIDPRAIKEIVKIEEINERTKSIEKFNAERIRNLTVKDLFREWINFGVSRQNSNDDLKQSFEKDVIPRIGSKQIRFLTDSDLIVIYRGIKKRASKNQPMDRTIIRLFDDIKQMFKWAEKRSPWRALLTEGNPAELVNIKNIISPNYIEQRDRILLPSEIQRLHRVIQDEIDIYNSSEKTPGSSSTKSSVSMCNMDLSRHNLSNQRTFDC